ncbi:hypothetical protein WOLCODRAFT_135598 [Wolfiporia cocos MD-104 SS10]|uniref:Protein CPL1-like domain-containing protein n=1 Tax=Wolfiporia cocos (strain MD-104) TaxID=742152 RepID=A0A2H3IWA6_WOLCO|nr:hypothetical protein WOLCODRAFT_135598 [Wolfiporia cocos MD-104 SS10]
MRSFIFAALGVAIAVLPSPAAALPSDSVLSARNPSPAVPVVPRAPGPSPAWRRHEARAPVPSNYKRSKREQLPIAPVQDISQQLCPLSMSVCPLSASKPGSLSEWIEQGFECVDLTEDLTSCGGCGSLDTQYDCTAIPGALGVSCQASNCRVHSCKSGFTLAPDGKTCVSSQ